MGATGTYLISYSISGTSTDDPVSENFYVVMKTGTQIPASRWGFEPANAGSNIYQAVVSPVCLTQCVPGDYLQLFLYNPSVTEPNNYSPSAIAPVSASLNVIKVD